VRDVPSEWLGPTDLERLVQLFTILHQRKERIRTLVSDRLQPLALILCHSRTGVRSLPLGA
jgi:hypothetical protein